MKFHLLLFLLLSGALLTAQEDYTEHYYPGVDSASRLASAGQRSAAMEIYQQLFREYRPVMQDLVKGLILAVELEDAAQTRQWIRLAVGRGATLEWLRVKGIKLKKIRKLTNWRTLKPELLTMRMQYLQTVDRNLRAEIRQMMAKDQLYRQLSKEQWQRNAKKQLEIDNKNIAQLRKIIEKLGAWPTEDHFGHWTVDNYAVNAYKIALHATRKEDIRYFEKILTEAHRHGQLAKWPLKHFFSMQERWARAQ